MLKSSVLYSWFFLVLFLFIYNTWDFNEGIIIRMSYFFRESFLCWAIIRIVGEQICLYIYIFITVILTNKTSNKYGSLRRNGEYDSGNYALLFNCCIPLSLVVLRSTTSISKEIWVKTNNLGNLAGKWSAGSWSYNFSKYN